MKKNKIIKTFIRWKVYYDRGRSYVSMLQSLLVVSIFIKLFELPSMYYYVLIPLFVLGMLIIGYLDKKYKLRENEIKEITDQNIIMNQIALDIKKILNEMSHEKSKENSMLLQKDRL